MNNHNNKNMEALEAEKGRNISDKSQNVEKEAGMEYVSDIWGLLQKKAKRWQMTVYNKQTNKQTSEKNSFNSK